MKAFILAPGSHTGTLLRLPWGGKWISPCCSRQGAGVLFELKFNRNIFFLKEEIKDALCVVGRVVVIQAYGGLVPWHVISLFCVAAV